MKNHLKLLSILLPAMLVAAAGHAQTATKLAVFDAQTIYTQSNVAKRAGDQLRSKEQQANQRIESLEKPLVEKQRKLAAEEDALAADKLKTAQDDLRKDYLNYRKEASRISQQFERDQYNARKQITDAMRTAVNQIAKEKGYDIVLPKGMTLYTGAGVPDITADVLTRVNAALK